MERRDRGWNRDPALLLHLLSVDRRRGVVDQPTRSERGDEPESAASAASDASDRFSTMAMGKVGALLSGRYLSNIGRETKEEFCGEDRTVGAEERSGKTAIEETNEEMSESMNN